MSSSSGSIERVKNSNINQELSLGKKTKIDISEKKVPTFKNNVDSEEKLKTKQVWKQQPVSSFDENSDADNAESDHSLDDHEKNQALMAASEPARSNTRSSAQNGFVLATNISTFPNSTMTTTATTTTSTFGSTITTTVTAVSDKIVHASAITSGVLSGQMQMANSEINFPDMDPIAAVALIKNFIQDADQKKLIINFQDDTGWNNLRTLLSDQELNGIAMPLGKEIILNVDSVPCYDNFYCYVDVLNDIGRSSILHGINLKSDSVLETWRMLKNSMERNANIEKLQISDATSDAVCGLFKIWREQPNMLSANAIAGLKITTLSFENLKISDAAVFGSVLRDMVVKMPNISVVDFSKTPLSAAQIDILSFQLESLGRKDLLQF